MVESIANKRTIGILLMAVGAILILMQYVGGHETIPIFLVGGAFLAIYFIKRIYGFLIPGCILTGVAFGLLSLDSIFIAGNSIVVCLGIGFAAIYLIDTIVKGKSHWWPLIPALALIGTGVMMEYGHLLAYAGKGWPYAIVAVGTILIACSFNEPRPEKVPHQPANE